MRGGAAVRGAGSGRDWPTSKRNWTAVETLLTFWPPGPEARTKVIVSSESGMNMGKCYLQNSLCRSRFVALALDEEGLHVLVLKDLHGLGSGALHNREECQLPFEPPWHTPSLNTGRHAPLPPERGTKGGRNRKIMLLAQGQTIKWDTPCGELTFDR